MVYIDRIIATFVDLLGEVRHDLRHPHAGLAALGELVRAAHQPAGILGSGKVGGYFVEIGFTVMLIEDRFRIEQIHLGSARHA